MKILAIDPGNIHSGWVIIDTTNYIPIEFNKTPNLGLLDLVRYRGGYDKVVIEMIASYGMAVGAEVFETCVWIGRFLEATSSNHIPAERTFRKDIKLHHCGTTKAKDSNITQALVDRFTPGQPNHGKGTKADPGWFHGFRADIWAAYALAVHAADASNRDALRPGTLTPESYPQSIHKASTTPQESVRIPQTQALDLHKRENGRPNNLDDGKPHHA